ncbi:MAG TPA: GAF domain-containing protein, partial [Solirubrobacteraceae bacterium]
MSGEEPGGLAEEQAALRRVATLVADGTSPEEVFAAVTDEVGQLLPVEFAIMGRYEADDTVTCVAAWGAPAARFRVGSRSKLKGKNLVTIVLETGCPARVDNFAHASGPIGVVGRESGFHSAVGTPIVVDGRVWGVMTVGATQLQPPLPAGTEARLEQFTELLETAVSNAESRAGLARLADEQAALRRVATLVAREAQPEEVFAAVVEEVGRLLCVQDAHLCRYEPDDTATIVAASGTDAVLPVGSTWPLGGKNVLTSIHETGRPARIASYADASGPVAVAARERGARTSVGTPIIVEQRLWGAVVAGSSGDQELPVDVQARLGSFTELVATAIANAESRTGLARLAEEQAALRRVATLVARGVPQDELFAAVAEEVVWLLPVDFAHMGRYESDGTVTVIATSGSTVDRFPVGLRWPLGGNNLSTIVFETGRPGRIDGYTKAFGPLGDTGRQIGIRSSAGTPIIVEGRVWGVVTAGSTVEQSLPADVESRLGSFTELVATAVANAESRAELTASRARIVAAADESRRRIERDLHDGAQQRLVHAVIVLKLALRALSNGDANARAGDRGAAARRAGERRAAGAGARHSARGADPRRAGRRGRGARVPGLRGGERGRVRRAPPRRGRGDCLFRHQRSAHERGQARPCRGRQSDGPSCGQLRAEIRDDGAGGARGGEGTGLGGLEDRVSALDGRLVVESPPGGGTRVCAVLPIA